MEPGKTCYGLILGLLFAVGCTTPEVGGPATLSNQVPGTGMLTGPGHRARRLSGRRGLRQKCG